MYGYYGLYTASDVTDRFVSSDYNGDKKSDIAGLNLSGIDTWTSNGALLNDYGKWWVSSSAQGKDAATTTQVATLKNGSNAPISYTYDADGNILTISEGGVLKVTYHYDELNELTREDNLYLNKTITYTYDVGGNLMAKTEYPYTTGTLGTATAAHSYAYGDSNWKDKLTSYDGSAITYDAIGNPLSYLNGWNFTWQQGRQLASASNGTTNISYKYNSDGIRTSKTVNGVTTTYYIEDGNIAWQTDGTNTIHYTYDANGDLAYMNLNGTLYYYERNGQGDIIGLVDSNMNEVVSYSYDSWGKQLSVGGSLASSVGTLNPFRYRGYYYDTETGLYYLNSRYYDSNTGRFLNADSVAGVAGDLLSTNAFAYSENNPVNNVDPSGQFSWRNVLIGVAIAAAVVAVVAVCVMTAGAAAPALALAGGGAWAGSLFAAAVAAAPIVGIVAAGISAVSSAGALAVSRSQSSSKAKTQEKAGITTSKNNPEPTYYRAQPTYPGAKVYVDQPINVEAAKLILDVGGSVYAKTASDAEYLCTVTGGGFSGPTNDGNPLSAMHYHPISYAARGHVFFGDDPNLQFVPLFN